MNNAATICGTTVAAAHDGSAEVVVHLEFENGGRTEVPLDAHAMTLLMQRCGVSTLPELQGHDWTKVRDALAETWNRFNS